MEYMASYNVKDTKLIINGDVKIDFGTKAELTEFLMELLHSQGVAY